MKNQKQPKLVRGSSFRGFRLGIQPKNKLNLKRLEKLSILTDSEHELVKVAYDIAITTDNPNLETEVDGTYKVSKAYIKRLKDVLDKPVATAKVDMFGNEIKQEELSKEDKEELLNKAKANLKKKK